MIPLFCFFPSLAAKQKKKETAKAVSFSASQTLPPRTAANKFESFFLTTSASEKYLSGRKRARLWRVRCRGLQSPLKKRPRRCFDYLLSPAKCSFVTLMTTGLSSSSAMRFGMDMRPLSVSEMSHTSVRSATAPAMTTRQKTI